MKLTKALLGEHGVFYAQFAYLEQIVPAATSLAQVQAQAALLSAALETHAGLENDLLFTALEAHLGPMGPLAVMRMEHDEIEHILAQLAETTDLSQAQELLQRLMQVAREHFAKEERVLFPLAEQHLGAQALQHLNAQWAERRGVSIA
jgi:regulator of cell morphogenesis and NO signaling